MTIFEKIDGILATLEMPFYSFMPEFAREPPDQFITYSIYDKPAQFGDGDEIATRFFVTVNIFVRNDMHRAESLYLTIKNLFTSNGFVRSGTVYTSDDDFPRYYRITADFKIDLYERMN